MAYIFNYGAKFQASLKWIIFKAYAASIPKHLNEPYFEENELGKSLRNDIVQDLINGKIYCLACKNIFSNVNNLKLTYTDVSDVIDQLSRNSIQVTDENDDPVTQQLISQDSPFYVSAHLALIDSLMIAFSIKSMRLENVISSIKKYIKYNPSVDLPSNIETTCVLWLNKIMKTVLNCIDSECEFYSKQSSLVRCQPHLFLPLIGNDISLSLSSGTILAVLIVFYTSNTDFDLSDISIQENVGFEEMVENLNLVKEFCDKFIGPRLFCFNFEDFLYSPMSMKINKLAFIAELFYLFEVNVNPSLIKPNHFDIFKDYIKKYTKKHFHATTPFISARIGDVTRNSFIRGSLTPAAAAAAAAANEINKLTTTTNSFNSLLDNVSLEASNNFDENNTYNNNSSNVNLRHELENDNEIEQHQDVHAMFSSRTYVKSSNNNHHNRMHLNQLTNEQSSNVTLNNANSNNNNNNRFVSLDNANQINNLSDSSSTSSNNNNNNKIDDILDSGMKTVRITNSNSNLILPIINPNETTNSNNNNNNNPLSSLFISPLTNVSSNNNINISNQPLLAKSPNGSPQSLPSSNANNEHQQQQQQQQQPQVSSGLVRRLSVTARPGDIFYKVKDVTETSSTTDNITNDIDEMIANENENNDINLMKHNENNTNKNIELSAPMQSTPSSSSSSSNIKQLENNTSNSTTQLNPNAPRRTTTWNVKKNTNQLPTQHQLPNIDSIPINNNSNNNLINTNIKNNVPFPAKEDLSLENLPQLKATLNNNVANIEPGSPSFTKELLSIRMQLKEKKSSMERDKRKLESELERQRQTIGKQVFLQVVSKKTPNSTSTPSNEPSSLNEHVNNNSNQTSQSPIPQPPVVSLTPTPPPPPTPNKQENLINQISPIVFNSHNSSSFEMSPSNLNTSLKERETSRRQWDKSKKNFDLENDTNNNNNNTINSTNNINSIKPGTASSTSSLSTPSSASQSPPLLSSNSNSNSNNKDQNDPMAVDLSKAYYSRDEMIKAIDALKDKYVRESTVAAELASQAGNKLVQSNNMNQTSNTNNSMVKDIEILNSKLMSLQGEINRLTLLQQQKQQNEQTTKPNTFNLNDERNSSNNNNNNIIKETLNYSSIDLQQQQQQQQRSNKSTNETTEDQNQNEGTFFISFGNGMAKREKPLALTSKKNLIFIKTNNDELSDINKNKTQKINNNLLMTAAGSSGQLQSSRQQHMNDLVNQIENNERGIEGDIDGFSSDGDSAELKQRKKELIMAKQLERRQQQELIRIKREEEKARKAEEVRMKEEELANKKQLEKKRKEIIYQAYIDKKKQLENESSLNSFGQPASQSLINAKRNFYSTNRLKQQSNQHQQLQLHQQQLLKQNLLDTFDQNSLYSERSTNLNMYAQLSQNHQPQQMMKTYSTNNLYQPSNSNISTSNNINNSNVNNNTVKRQSRNIRPPSCARPTISSLRKMNRTFSLNNVSEAGLTTNQIQTQSGNTQGGSNTPKSTTPTLNKNQMANNNNIILPLTKASLAMANASSSSFNSAYLNNNSSHLNNNDDQMLIQMNLLNESNKFNSKYASSTYLNESVGQLSSSKKQFQPQQTRTTPRRRTPRNAQEFLIAAGVQDAETYLTKGFYNGSMLNLNEISTSSSNNKSIAINQSNNNNNNNNNSINTNNNQNDQILQNPTSSSSSSSMNNYNKKQSSSSKYMNMMNMMMINHQNAQNNNNNISNNDQYLQLDSNTNTTSMKRRNSVHETTSVSMANLNFLNNNFISVANNNNNINLNNSNKKDQQDEEDEMNAVTAAAVKSLKNNSYFRNKTRSATTAIVPSLSIQRDELNNVNDGNQSDPNNGEGSTTSHGGSSLPGSSDSSSSPTPPKQQQSQQKQQSLGPLMSAVTKADESLIQMSPLSNNNSNNNYKDQRYINNNNYNNGMIDDYDDYEYLERNFGAEPTAIQSQQIGTNHINNNNNNNNNINNNSNPKSLIKDRNKNQLNSNNDIINTTTNTNVTDYYTDESSYNNEDFKSNGGRFIMGEFNNQSPLMNTNKLIMQQQQQQHINNLNYYNNNNRNINKQAIQMNGGNMMQMPQNINMNMIAGLGWDNGSCASNNSILSGPKLFKRLTGKSNKLSIVNSLNQLVLAGTVNAQIRKQVIEEIEASDARHFVILFRDYHLQYRGVYSYTTETDYIEKLIGQGPQKISEDMIEKYYKYNSGGKQFSPVPTKHFSVQCDAVTIHSVFWASRKQSNPVTNVAQLGLANSNSAIGLNMGMAGIGNMQSNMMPSSNHGTLRR